MTNKTKRRAPASKAHTPLQRFTADVRLWHKVEGFAQVIVEARDEAEATRIVRECLELSGREVPGVVLVDYTPDNGEKWIEQGSHFELYRGHHDDPMDAPASGYVGEFDL